MNGVLDVSACEVTACSHHRPCVVVELCCFVVTDLISFVLESKRRNSTDWRISGGIH